jgi:hypothetical protein
MNMSRIVSGLVAISLCVGCTGLPIGAARPSADATGEELTTRVFLSDLCPTEAKGESLWTALIGGLLQSVVESVIGSVGEAIKQAGEDRDTTRTALANDHFYKVNLGSAPSTPTELNLKSECITVIHGKLSAGDVQRQQLETENFLKRFNRPDKAKEIEEDDAALYLSPDPNGSNQVFSDDIRFYGRYKVIYSDDRTAIQLEPVRFLVGDPFVTPRGGWNGKRDIVVVLSLRTPSQNVNDGAFAISTTKLGSVKPNSVVEGSEAIKSGWMPMAPIPDSVDAMIKANATRQLNKLDFDDTIAELEAPGQKNPAEAAAKLAAAKTSRDRLTQLLANDAKILKNVSPVTFSVSIVETQKGDEFLVKLGTFLSSKKSELAKPFVEELDPAKRAAAAAAADDEEDTLRIAALEAVATYDAEAAKAGTARDETKVKTTKIQAAAACRHLRAAGYDDVACVGL